MIINGENVLRAAKIILFLSLMVIVYSALAIIILFAYWIFELWPEIANSQNIFLVFKILLLASCVFYLANRLFDWTENKKLKFISSFIK